MAEVLTRFPPLWKPTQEGETLTGEVVASKNDEQYGFSCVLKQQDGTEVSTPGHKNLSGTLKSNFDSGKIKVGDKLTIKYLGMRTAKKKNGKKTDPFNDYEVVKE